MRRRGKTVHTVTCPACGAVPGALCTPAWFGNGDPRPMFKGGAYHDARVSEARRATMRLS